MTTKIKSFDDLKKLRQQARAQIQLRSGKKDMRITVHMGTCGIAAGARDILLALMESIGDQDANVTIQQSGCVGLCEQEPMITITDKAGEIFRYGLLDKNKVREIVEKHVNHGKVINEYLLKA